MKLEDVLMRLPDDLVAHTALNDPDCDISTVAFLTSWDARNLRSDVLYFSDTTLLPEQVDDDRMFSCVVVEQDGGEHLAKHPNVNLVWLTEGTNFYSCYNDIQAAFLEDKELSAATRKLLAAHFSNHGLQYLIEEAASTLGNPLVVVDPSYHYIAYHLGLSPDDDSETAHAIRGEIANEMVYEEGVAYIRDKHID